MKVGYCSDLHLEFLPQHYDLHKKAVKGDVLIVAGDLISVKHLRPSANDAESRSIKKLMEKVRKNWFDQYDRVFYVMGNHEHYHFDFDDTKQALRDYFAGTNVTLLDNDMVYHGDYTFIGATLWSDFEQGSPLSMYRCQQGMRDYHAIVRGSIPISADFTLNQHEISKKYIEMAVKNGQGPFVVITHHGPTLKSLHPDHVGNGMDGAYCSDLSDLILDNRSIKYWIHGHTHESMAYNVGDCRVLANQMGYYFEKSFKWFKGIQQMEI